MTSSHLNSRWRCALLFASALALSGCAARVVDPNTGRKVYSSTDRKIDATRPVEYPITVRYENHNVTVYCRDLANGETVCRVP